MAASPDLPRVALIAGPTASGKSALALALAERLDGTVINADASQVYSDLRVLSARPSATDEARAPHRLFGHIDGADPGYSAARWAAEAREAIARSHAEGCLPILVGGTGLYLRTLLDGIAPIPEIDPEIRRSVRAMPTADAYRELQRLDPDQARQLNPADAARIARALEVARSTGRSITAWRQQRIGGIGASIRLVATILLPPRDWLDARIVARTDLMLGQGAIDEVKALLARTDVPATAPVRRAIGVDAIASLIAGSDDVEAVRAAITLATRQYAKRQYTWFRNQPPADWQRTDSIDSNDMINEIERRLLD